MSSAETLGAIALVLVLAVIAWPQLSIYVGGAHDWWRLLPTAVFTVALVVLLDSLVARLWYSRRRHRRTGTSGT